MNIPPVHTPDSKIVASFLPCQLPRIPFFRKVCWLRSRRWKVTAISASVPASAIDRLLDARFTVDIYPSAKHSRSRLAVGGLPCSWACSKQVANCRRLTADVAVDLQLLNWMQMSLLVRGQPRQERNCRSATIGAREILLK